MGYSVSVHRATAAGVGLLGPVQRPLGGEAQIVQGAPDAGHREVHAEPGGDQPADDPAGPQRHGEPVIARIGLGDQRGQLTQLLAGELARPPGHRPGPQRLPAPAALRGQPGVDRPPVQAECRQPRADLGRRHAPGHLLGRPQPQHLQRPVVQLAAVVLPHSSSVPAHGSHIKLLTISSVRAVTGGARGLQPSREPVTHFAVVIRGTAEPIRSGRDGRKTLRVVDALIEATRTGQPAALTQ